MSVPPPPDVLQCTLVHGLTNSSYHNYYYYMLLYPDNGMTAGSLREHIMHVQSDDGREWLWDP